MSREKSRQKGTRGSKSLGKMKTKMVVSRAFLKLPVRKSPEISMSCLSRNLKTKRSLHLSCRSSLQVKEKSQKIEPDSVQPYQQQSRERETSVCTPDSGPYRFDDDENEEELLKNAPAGGKERGTSEVKKNVLRTMSRMLQENRIIREQWIRLSQCSGGQQPFPSLAYSLPRSCCHIIEILSYTSLIWMDPETAPARAHPNFYPRLQERTSSIMPMNIHQASSVEPGAGPRQLLRMLWLLFLL